MRPLWPSAPRMVANPVAKTTAIVKSTSIRLNENLKENAAFSVKEPSFGLFLSTLLLKFAENSFAMLQSGEKYINPLTDFQTAEISQLTTEDLRAYELSVNAYRDIKNGIDAAKKEGMEKGIEKGIAIGTEKGIAIGTKNKAMEIARNMAREGIPYATISKVTGLTVEEIEGLV